MPPGEVFTRPTSAAVAGLVGQRNVVAGVRTGGTVRCAWGRFRATGADGSVAVLVPPDAVRDGLNGAAGGALRGIVNRPHLPGRQCLRRRGRRRLPALDVAADPSWRVGDEVVLGIDEDLVVMDDMDEMDDTGVDVSGRASGASAVPFGSRDGEELEDERPGTD